MPRRHGWLQDYHYHLDQGDDRTVRTNPSYTPSTDSDKSTNQVPVNINININLGDILSQIAGGKKSAKEALEEMVNEDTDHRQLLTED